MRTRRPALYIIIAINLIGVALIGLILMNYVGENREQLYERSREAFAQATSEIATAVRLYFEGRQALVTNARGFLEKFEGGATLQQASDFLVDFTASDSCDFHLISCATCAGLSFSGGGEPLEVNYLPRRERQGAYADIVEACARLARGEEPAEAIAVIPAFTNPVNALQSLAFYADVNLVSADGESEKYVLMCVVREDRFVGSGLPLPAYKSAASAVIETNGNYVVKTRDFKSVNFFEYLYGYNLDLFDEVEALKKNVAGASGTFRMLDHAGAERLYAYVPLPGTDSWSYVTSVPITSLEQHNINLSFALMLATSILTLALFNVGIMLALTRRLKISLRESGESMRAAEKANMAKSEFLSRMSHDMRTPINGILGFSELTLAEPLSPVVRGNLEKINRACGFLLSLVNDTLDMSKIESQKMTLTPAPVMCQQLLEDSLDAIRPLAESGGISLEFEASGCDVTLSVDQLRMRQVLNNILSNAAKFTSAGGTIAMRANCVPEGERYMLTVAISDDGCGMSKEFLPTIFEPFSQERTSGSGGTGLGMSIVKNLIELMGGSAEVESELGKGTTITVRAPFEPAEAVADKPVEELKVSLDGRRLLVCEDNDMNAEIISRVLASRNCLVDRAENGRIGLELFEASAYDYYQAIIMDIRMPVMGGLEATRLIRALKREDARRIPIIAMTADAFDEDRDMARAAGMNEFLTKPIEARRMLAAIAEQIARRE